MKTLAEILMGDTPQRTLAELLKVVDANGAHHGSDGRFATGSGTKAAKPSPMAAAKKTDDSHLPQAPSHHKARANWTRTLAGPTFAKIEVSAPHGEASSEVHLHLNNATKTATVRKVYFNESNYGACLVKMIREVQKNAPDIERFERPPLDKVRTRADYHKSYTDEDIARYANVTNKRNAAMTAVWDSLFTSDGRPNDFFGKGTVAMKVTAPSQVADQEVMKVLPKAQREAVVSAVDRELRACSMMPTKLAMLTDAPVVGIKSATHSLAWACPGTQGHIVRVVATKSKWQDVFDGKKCGQVRDDGSLTPSVFCSVDPEHRMDVIITHEMGHILEFQLKAAKDSHPEIYGAYQALVAERNNRKPSTSAEYAANPTSKHPSRYGMTNFAEYFAESWACYRHPDLGLQCPDAAKKFFEMLGVEAIRKILAQLYLLDNVPGATEHVCGMLEGDNMQKAAGVLFETNDLQKTIAEWTALEALSPIKKSDDAILPGHAITIAAHVKDGMLHPADTGRVLRTTVDDLGCSTATYHSATRGESRTVGCAHAARLRESEKADEGNEHVSILPLSIADHKHEGSSVVMHQGKAMGTLDPSPVGALTGAHTVKSALGSDAQIFADRKTAIAAIHAHYTPQD